MPELPAGRRGLKRFGGSVSPLGGGVLAQFVWAVPLAALLWVAAAWAMGWLA